MLFFARAPRHSWKAQDIAVALKLPEEVIKGALDGLPASLIERSSSASTGATYRYAPSEELAPLVERLRHDYDEQRIAVVQIMTANAIERVRTAAGKRLADAFRLDRSKK